MSSKNPIKKHSFLIVITLLIVFFATQASGEELGPIRSGETKSSSIDPIADVDTFNFYGDAGDTVIIAMTATAPYYFSECLELYDPDGFKEKWGYDSISNYKLLKSGLYTIVCREYGNDDTSEYSLSFLKIPGSFLSPSDLDGGDIISGEILSGQIMPIADTDGFNFYGNAGETLVQIVMTATAPYYFSECLELYDPDGFKEKWGYDSISNHQLLKSGLYTIVCREYGNDDTSEYSLSFTKLPAAFPPGVYNPTPANGAFVYYTTDLIDWDDTQGATSYDVYFGTDVVTPLEKIAEDITVSYCDLPSLLDNTTYYWKIVAKSDGDEIPGPVWTFTAGTLPETPANPSPEDGATDVPIIIDLIWDESSGATSYDVYFGTTSPPPKVGTETSSFYNLETLNFGTTYYWKVVAKNDFGDTEGPIWNFTTREMLSFILNIYSTSGGTTSPSPGVYSYDEGEEPSIEAMPDTGYRFGSWTGDVPAENETDNPVTITMDGDKSITANFIREYTLTIASGSRGATDPSPGSYKYDSGAEVSVTATPESGYRFVSWTGDVPAENETDNPVTITMDGDKSITANFIREYTLTIASGSGGTTDPSPGSYKYDSGAEVSVTATPESGYRFVSWTGDVPTENETDNPVTITMDGDKSITANFNIIEGNYELSVDAMFGGTIDPAPGMYSYPANTLVTITAIPDTGYRFEYWSGDVLGTDNPITITIDENISIIANFVRIIYAPLNFTGDQEFNRSLLVSEYINVLTWEANSDNENIAKYRIYQINESIPSLLEELNADTFEYLHRNVEKDAQYTYALCAVNDEGREGESATTTIQGEGVKNKVKDTKVATTAVSESAHNKFSEDTTWTGNPIIVPADSNKSATANSKEIYKSLNFAAQKVLDRSLPQGKYINILTWQTNPENQNIEKYRIYLIEGQSQILLVELSADTFEYYHRDVEKEKEYIYALVAIAYKDREGEPTFITIK